MFLYYLLILFYIVVCVGLIFFILIQSNKGMGLSGAFGAMGASDSVFGSSGGINVVMKITIGLVVVYTITTLTLSVVPPPARTGGIIEQETLERPQPVSEMIDQGKAGGASVDLPTAGEAGAAAQPGAAPAGQAPANPAPADSAQPNAQSPAQPAQQP
ncbi:MAG TPA: preprotein translocase subunit SecG [bacterium]|nr:preprotein translocase subunit SecG [bacterium]